MFRRLTAALFAIVLTLPAMPALAQSDTGRRITSPPVQLSSKVVDFGDVRPGTTTVRSATIVNESDERIRIRGVRVSCGCTIADWPESWIEPGESVEIELTFESGDLWGPVQRYALLQFEGFTRPMRITTMAHVNHGIRAERAYDPMGQTMQGTLTLHSTDGKPFRVLAMSFASEVEATDGAGSAPGLLRADALDESLASEQLAHTLNFDFTTVDPERLRRWIAIETDHPTAPVVTMHIDNPFAGIDRRRRLWVFASDHLLLDAIQPGESRTETLTLRGMRSEVLVDRLEIDSDLLGAEIVSTSFDQAAGLRIEYRLTASEEASGLVHTTLRVRAADFEDTTELMLRVSEDAEPAESPKQSEPSDGGD
jgi:hypothetical protein